MPPALAAHKPGAIALRPLNLGDFYGSAFVILRKNATATIGLALIVCALCVAIPMVLSIAVSSALGADWGQSMSFDATSSAEADLLSVIPQLAGMIPLALVGVILTSLVAGVVHGAALGKTYSLGQAWALTKGRRGAMVGFAALYTLLGLVVMTGYIGLGVVLYAATDAWALVVLYALFAGFAILCAWVFVMVRYVYLAPAPLLVERLSIFAALRRSGELTKGAFWRTFGIVVLTNLLVGLASQVVALPLALIAGGVSLIEGVGLILSVVITGLSTVIAAAVTTPYLSAVLSLQYLDLRIRKEAYDVELMGLASGRSG